MASQPLERADVYTRVTAQIVSAIEAGIDRGWERPWQTSQGTNQYPVNIATGARYRGANVIALWAESQLHGYAQPTWGTFKQWSDLGHRVVKGERAAIGVFWKPLDAVAPGDDQDGDEAGNADRSRRWVARAFPLFNAAQIVGYEPPPEPIARPQHERIAHAEAFVAALKATIRHGGNRAFYRQESDLIQMPAFPAFVEPLDYYSTLMHEITHWTGNKIRLSRDLTGRFGSESYAMEELIAELGAAFLAADLGLSPDARAENTTYINSWLKVLKADSRAIFTASSLAQRAADYAHSLQPAVQPISTPAVIPYVSVAETPQLAFNL